ncbi:hypothetical protein E1J38_003190 [Seonamhaeicola sediminis]|uniref:Molybdenum ABC transporter permease n=1 Tax=Seonamhaeicola sediminis TaxID=2528206 RepID=A0A562YGU7_9FLAO|nr:hypothetical protein [Seonamhaeicola sediminis]TWO33795.1 hypothetical protein E1J38_003190 [Seonamhaeicola sediminis]
MMYYIAAIAMFVLVGYIIHKLAYKRFEKLNGRKPKRRELYSIYHWESVLGLSAVVILILVYILKISNVLPL